MSLRTPDPKLVGNQAAMDARLGDLTARAQSLEPLFDADDIGSAVSPKWRGVLDAFRVLTISATASGTDVTACFLVSLYEAATRAALFSGDLSLFNLFRSRLVRDVYPMDTDTASVNTGEYESLGVLFYGAVTRQPLELAMILRRLSPSISIVRSPAFVFAMQAVQCVSRNDAFGFLRLYSTAPLLPKALLTFALPDMKSVAYRTLIRAYTTLDSDYAAKLLLCAERRSIYEGIVGEDERLSITNPDFSAAVIALRPKRK